MIEKNSYRNFLVLQLAFMLSCPVILDEGLIGKIIEMLLGLSLLTMGIMMTNKRRKGWLAASSPFLLAAVVVLWLYGIFHPGLWGLTLLRISLFILFFMRVVFVVAQHVFLSPRVSTSNRLYGAMSVYVMISAFFANLFQLLNILHPDSFVCHSVLCPDGVDAAFGMGVHFYYSLATMTTVGFGDITPATPFAAMVSAMEALLGQLYVAIVVARLVGLHLLENGQQS